MKQDCVWAIVCLMIVSELVVGACGAGTGAQQTAGVGGTPQPALPVGTPTSPVDAPMPTASSAAVATIGMVYPAGELAAPVVAPPPIPEYPGAKVVSTKERGMEFNAKYVTTDDPDTVYNFYRTELPKCGWEAKPNWSGLRYGYNPLNSYVPNELYGKPWGHYLFVTATRQGSQTSITIWRVEESWKTFATPIPLPVISSYPGATLVSEEVIPPGGNPAVEYGELSRIYTTADAQEKVEDFYSQALRHSSWFCGPIRRGEPVYLQCTYGTGEVEKYHLRAEFSRAGDRTYIKIHIVHSDR